MQGKNLRTNEITQEIYDETRSFRVISGDRTIILKSRPALLTASAVNNTPWDLHQLMGHENI